MFDSKLVFMFVPRVQKLMKPTYLCFFFNLFSDASEAFRVYTDEANKFEISIPQGKNYQSSNIVVTKTMINERNLTALFTQKRLASRTSSRT